MHALDLHQLPTLCSRKLPGQNCGCIVAAPSGAITFPAVSIQVLCNGSGVTDRYMVVGEEVAGSRFLSSEQVVAIKPGDFNSPSHCRFGVRYEHFRTYATHHFVHLGAFRARWSQYQNMSSPSVISQTGSQTCHRLPKQHRGNT